MAKKYLSKNKVHYLVARLRQLDKEILLVSVTKTVDEMERYSYRPFCLGYSYGRIGGVAPLQLVVLGWKG